MRGSWTVLQKATFLVNPKRNRIFIHLIIFHVVLPHASLKFPEFLKYIFNIAFISVSTTTETGQPTQGNVSSNKTMIFILSGSMAFILLLVSSFVLGVLCYRKLHRKRIDRLLISKNRDLARIAHN